VVGRKRKPAKESAQPSAGSLQVAAALA